MAAVNMHVNVYSQMFNSEWFDDFEDFPLYCFGFIAVLPSHLFSIQLLFRAHLVITHTRTHITLMIASIQIHFRIEISSSS